MPKRHNKRRNYKGSRQYWKPRKQSKKRRGGRKRKGEDDLKDVLSNETIQILILKALAIIALVITVVGGALFIVYRILTHSEWPASIKTALTTIVLVVAVGILVWCMPFIFTLILLIGSIRRRC